MINSGASRISGISEYLPPLCKHCKKQILEFDYFLNYTYYTWDEICSLYCLCGFSQSKINQLQNKK